MQRYYHCRRIAVVSQLLYCMAAENANAVDRPWGCQMKIESLQADSTRLNQMVITCVDITDISKGVGEKLNVCEFDGQSRIPLNELRD